MQNKELSIIFEVLKSFFAEDNKEIYPSPDTSNELLYKLIRHHRLESFFLKGSSCYKWNDSDYDLVKMGFLSNKARQLALIHELQQVTNAFDENNIFYFAFKGPLLSLLLYDNIIFRSSKDIDLFIAKEDILKAEEILMTRSYKSLHPCNLSSDLKERYHKHYTQAEYVQDMSKIKIELHWQLFNNAAILPGEYEKFQREIHNIEFEGQSYNLPGQAFIFVYLCVHGTQHNWLRLFWLADIAMYVKKYTDESFWNEVKEQAVILKAQRSVGVALFLIRDLFEMELPRQLSGFTEISKVATMVKNSQAFIEDDFSEGLKFGHSLKIASTNLKMHSSIAYKLKYLLFLTVSYHDWEVIRLPNALFWLYYPLRPFIWLYRKIFRK